MERKLGRHQQAEMGGWSVGESWYSSQRETGIVLTDGGIWQEKKVDEIRDVIGCQQATM
jgi:hypothetical protein